MLDILYCTISNQYEPFVCFKNVSIIWRDIQVHSKQESQSRFFMIHCFPFLEFSIWIHITLFALPTSQLDVKYNVMHSKL